MTSKLREFMIESILYNEKEGYYSLGDRWLRVKSDEELKQEYDKRVNKV